ncbi:FG-GAP-like repeat-containing protein, partial [Elusimicrobiota bacterium]
MAAGGSARAQVPVSSVTLPTATYLKTLPVVSGTAEAFAGETITQVRVSIMRVSDSQYWNGAAWAAGPLWNLSSFLGSSSGTWSYNTGAVSWTHDESYVLKSTATDSAAGEQMSMASHGFTYDTVTPVPFISFPPNQSSQTNWTVVSGTAFDTTSGIAQVLIRISSSSSYSTYWSSAAQSWSGIPTDNPAVGTTNWTFEGVPSGAGLVAGTSYYLDVRVADGAGNEDVDISTFYYTGGSWSSVWNSLETESTAGASWGDYDGDGDLDLVVANASSQANRVYRNNGDGTFVSAWNSVEAEDTGTVSWGDFDGDGDLDLAVGNYSQTNRVYRNNGDGTLTSVWNSLEGEITNSVSWGDYDGDGDLDLAAGNMGSQQNRVYRNNGDGTFSGTWLSLESEATNSLSWGDYDGDGYLDLVSGNTGVARLYRNNGAGILTGVWSSSEGESPRSLSWGDYDADGDLDLAAGQNTGQTNRVYRNDGGGAFLSAWNSLEGEETLIVSWGDYDGDGDLDLAAGNGSFSTNRVYRNNGDGTFAGVWNSPDTEGTYALLWADYDGDGDLDLAVGNYNQTNRVYKGVSPGANIAPTAPGGLEVDFDYDTTLSTLTLRWAAGDYDSNGSTPSVHYSLAVTTIPMALSGDDSRIVSPSSMTAEGFVLKGEYLSPAYKIWPGDGSPKHGVVISTMPDIPGSPLQTGTTYYLRVQTIDAGLARSTWSGEVSVLFEDPASAPPGAIPDLYVSATVSTGFGASTMSVTLTWTAPGEDGASGDIVGGTFTVRYSDVGPILDDADFNSAPYSIDLATDVTQGEIQTHTLTGLSAAATYFFVIKTTDSAGSTSSLSVAATGYSYARPVDGTGVNSHEVSWGDYDGDGDWDFAMTVWGAEDYIATNDGTGAFSTFTLTGTSGNSEGLAWCDYDNDGDLDLAVADDSGGNTFLMRNDGGASFTKVTIAATGGDSSGIAWGDYDNDGDFDIAVANKGIQDEYLLRNDGGSFTKIILSGTAGSTRGAAWG